jgi:hypothetical protein
MKRAEDAERLEDIKKKVYRYVAGESRGQISNGRVIYKRRQENGTNISVYFNHRTMTGVLIKKYV